METNENVMSETMNENVGVNGDTPVNDGGLGSYYERSEGQTKRRSKEEIFAKFFKPRNQRETFRILPLRQGDPFFEVAYFHVVPTLMTGGKVKNKTTVLCLSKNFPHVPKLDATGKPILDESGRPIMVPQHCPLCEKHKRILSKQDQNIRYKKRDEVQEHEKHIWDNNREIFKEANKWEAKEHYIIRGVDKGKPVDGVKFWRIRKNFKKDGVMDRLAPILDDYIQTHKVVFYDIERGTDLSIAVGEGRWMDITFPEVKTISTKGPSPLTLDPSEKMRWLNDKITWKDVYLPKKAPNVTPQEYMELLAEGNCPYYDENIKRWIFPSRPDLEELANTKKGEFGSENEYEGFVDEDDDVIQQPSINTITEKHVSNPKKDDVVNVYQQTQRVEPPKVEQSNDYDDLPF